MTDRDFAGSRDAAVGSLITIRAALPAQLQTRALARRAKIPFKVALYRDSLLWRIDELGHAALAASDQQHHIAPILVTRGVMESVARSITCITSPRPIAAGLWMRSTTSS